MKPILKIKYIIDNDKMTDEEYDTQEEREFFLTKNMLVELMEQNVKFENGDRIDTNYFEFEIL